MISSFEPGSVFNREGDMLSRVYARLQRAGEDRLVRGIILRLDTPGGDVTSSDILYREILKFKKKTGLPVVALMMSVAASGGYYVASACDAIVAHPSTITGSIGVISLFPDVEGLPARLGVKVQVVKSGELKDAGSPIRNLSEEEQRLFQGIVDELYDRFLEVNHKKRKDALSLEEIRVGQVEAPRGTLYHHYVTDRRGIVQKVNLIGGTTNNYAPISMSVNRAARALIQKGTVVTEGLLNRVEMAFRLYDPCFGCATHSLPGQMPLEVRIRAAHGETVDVIRHHC